MKRFTIAPAGAADLPAVAELFQEYAAALPVDLGAQGFIEELAELPGSYKAPRGTLLLARFDGGDACGCVALRPLTENACEVKRLYVSPSARGAGIGRALVSALLSEARHLGYREVKLDTLSNMIEAISLYRSFGFRPIPPTARTPTTAFFASANH